MCLAGWRLRQGNGGGKHAVPSRQVRLRIVGQRGRHGAGEVDVRGHRIRGTALRATRAAAIRNSLNVVFRIDASTGQAGSQTLPRLSRGHHCDGTGGLDALGGLFVENAVEASKVPALKKPEVIRLCLRFFPRTLPTAATSLPFAKAAPYH